MFKPTANKIIVRPRYDGFYISAIRRGDNVDADDVKNPDRNLITTK